MTTSTGGRSPRKFGGLPYDRVLTDDELRDRAWQKYAAAVALVRQAGNSITLKNIALAAGERTIVVEGYLGATPAFVRQFNVEPWT